MQFLLQNPKILLKKIMRHKYKLHPKEILKIDLQISFSISGPDLELLTTQFGTNRLEISNVDLQELIDRVENSLSKIFSIFDQNFQPKNVKPERF